MLTLFGYAIPATLAVLGVMGLLSGYVPFFTRRPVRGWQIRAASLILIIPMAGAVWIGMRDPSIEPPLTALREAHESQSGDLRQAETIAGEIISSLDRSASEMPAISEEQVPDIEARLGSLESARDGARRLPELISAARSSLEDRAVPARNEAAHVAASLQEYQRFFDRLFISLLAILVAVMLIPATKPYPTEPVPPSAPPEPAEV